MKHNILQDFTISLNNTAPLTTLQSLRDSCATMPRKVKKRPLTKRPREASFVTTKSSVVLLLLDPGDTPARWCAERIYPQCPLWFAGGRPITHNFPSALEKGPLFHLRQMTNPMDLLPAGHRLLEQILVSSKGPCARERTAASEVRAEKGNIPNLSRRKGSALGTTGKVR